MPESAVWVIERWDTYDYEGCEVFATLEAAKMTRPEGWKPWKWVPDGADPTGPADHWECWHPTKGETYMELHERTLGP